MLLIVCCVLIDCLIVSQQKTRMNNWSVLINSLTRIYTSWDFVSSQCLVRGIDRIVWYSNWPINLASLDHTYRHHLLCQLPFHPLDMWVLSGQICFGWLILTTWREKLANWLQRRRHFNFHLHHCRYNTTSSTIINSSSIFDPAGIIV